MTLTQMLTRPRIITLTTSDGVGHPVTWGESWEHGTAAYWVEATLRADHPSTPDRHQLTPSLSDEVALCMLGGFGMPYELGLAAYTALHDQVLQHNPTPSEAAIRDVLVQPMVVGMTTRKYRFPHQRATRLARALQYVHASPTPAAPLQIRDWLTEAPGIGAKTASWIVRNRWPHAPVAILDVHVLRAGIRATVFPTNAKLSTQYRRLEELFVGWARAGEISPADLDATIWAEEAFRARHPF